jgi:magnesium transporter
MVKKYRLVENALVMSEADDSPVQVYIHPDDAEKNTLRTVFDIDDHTLSSSLDPDEVSRIEFFDEGMTLIWKRPTNYSGQDNFFFNVASVGFFLTRERLIVVMTEDVPLFGAGARQICKPRSPQDVMLNALYNTIHHYLEHLKIIKWISRELQQKINTSMANEHLIQMFNLSESLVYYLNAVNANNGVLVKLKSHAEKVRLDPETVEIIDDIIIENNQCFKQAEIYSTVFSGLMDARGSLVNNNMNVLLKNLTLINVVFLPLNLIASIGGMSEFTMMTQGIDWRIAYSLFLVAMIATGSVTAYFISRIYLRRNVQREGRRRLGFRRRQA